MPGENVKPLHKGKCLDDLKSLYDIPELEPKRLCKSAPKLFKAAEEARIIGDEEVSYIYYMKFLSIAQRVKQYQKNNKKEITDGSAIKPVEIKEALDYADKLSKSLQFRYQELKQKEAEANKIKEAKIIEKITESTSKAVVPENVQGYADVCDGFISCAKLYYLLDSKKKVLIMDVRSPLHFSDSKLKYNCAIINVPDIVVKAGMTAQKLEKELPTDVKMSWSRRGDVDLVVLVDWSTSTKYLKNDSSVAVLRDILCKWDSDTHYKNPPLILNGGFEEWLLCYPALTTNPSIKFSSPLDSVGSADFSDIEYPNLSESSDSPQPSFDRSSKPALNMIHSPVPTSPSNTFAKCVTPKSSKTVPSNTFSPISPKSSVPTKGPSSSSTSTASRPSIDRKSKAAAVLTYEERSKNVQALLRQQEKVVASSLELEENRQSIEIERERIRLCREMEAEEEMRLQLQEREEQLLRDIEQKEQQQLEKDQEIKALKAELAEYKRREQEESLTKEHLIFKKQEEEIAARIHNTEEKRKKLVQAREKKNNEEHVLKNKQVVGDDSGPNLPYEERQRLAHAKLQQDRLMRKKQEEMAKEKERGDSENNKSSVHSVDKERKSVQITNEQNINFKNKMNGTYTAPLKDTPSGIMKRSHSSPNIAQMNDDELNPRGKPYKSSYTSDIRSSRQRNFSPVYGDMGRGLTGLKNLGNTCYMNSIIQCLSNTTPLATYFVSGEYRKDINRQTETHGEIAEEVAAVVRAIWSSSYKSIATRDLRCVVGRHRDQFQTNQQQDSNEFLTILMDWLHEDLKKPSIKTANDSGREQPDWEKQWDEFYKENSSLIVLLFYGQQKSTVTCLNCYKESVRYETFSNLTLPLPSNSNSCTLEDCVQLYVQGERITGWKCPACKEHREARKKFDIIKLPPILIIHFKRFYIDGWCRKRQTFVQFPLKDFDMRKYTLFSEQKYTKFNLYGVSNHYGTMEGGHYTAYCKSSEHKKWYKFDDNEVSEISSSEVQSGAAYILFYASINLNIPDVS